MAPQNAKVISNVKTSNNCIFCLPETDYNTRFEHNYIQCSSHVIFDHLTTFWIFLSVRTMLISAAK